MALNRRKRKENNIIFIGIIIIINGLVGLLTVFIFNMHYDKLQDKKINEFIEKQNSITIANQIENNIELTDSKIEHEDYFAVIEIPKINLRAGIYSKESKLNDVDKNVMLLNESDTPDIVNGNMILAGHSGLGRTAYFKNLIKLKNNDTIHIYYNNKKYEYKVEKIYYIEKNGKLELESSSSNSILTLITCDETNKSKQIVFVCIKK